MLIKYLSARFMEVFFHLCCSCVITKRGYERLDILFATSMQTMQRYKANSYIMDRSYEYKTLTFEFGRLQMLSSLMILFQANHLLRLFKILQRT